MFSRSFLLGKDLPLVWFSWFLKSLVPPFLPSSQKLFLKLLHVSKFVLDIWTNLYVFFFCMFVLSLCLWQQKSFPFLCLFPLFLDIFIFCSLSWISVFPLFLCNNFCISCRWAADWPISWSGHPRPSHWSGTSVPWVSLPGPTVWWLIQAGWWVTKGPTLFCCSALGFCCTDCTLDVFTCNITKLDQCCELILRRRKIKPNWDVTWRDLHGWKTQLILTRSPQPCEYTFAFTIVLLRCSLDLRLAHSVLSRYFSASLYCEVHVLPDSHHLLSLDFHHLADGGQFVVQLGLQLASALPSLLALTWPLRFNIDHGLLDLPRHSLPRRSRFLIYTRVLWHAADIDFFAFGSWNFLIVNVWQFHCRVLIVTVLFCTCSCEWAFTASLNNSRWATWHHTNRDNVTTSSGLFTTSSTWNVCRSSHSDDMVIHLISQLVIHDFVASESSDTISTTSTAKLFCRTVFARRSWSRRTPPQSLHTWDSAG